MDSNKEFDQFIRDRVSDMEFAGEKDSWELLNYRLKERVKAKQRKRLFKFLFSSLLVVSGVWFVLVPSRESKDIAESKGNISNVNEQVRTPVNSPGNSEIKRNSITKRENKNFSLQPEEENLHAPVTYNSVDGNDKNILNEPAAEIPDEKKVSAPELTDEELSAAINSYDWRSGLFKIEITNAGKAVNSAYSDFAPVISADGSTMFFTSRRPVTEKGTKEHRQAEEHVYSSSLNSKKNIWANTFMLANAINADGRNNSVIGFSNDGQRMLLYRDDIYGNGDIYESFLQGTDWTLPVLLPGPVNTKYHESSASISPDGKTLYFVSDRPGGTGGRDIWFCTLGANGQWSNATNIGTPVNTPYDEEGIFIHGDGKTIYFSSKRHDGLGGFDVYRTICQQADGSWNKPMNLGAPLNTPGDDVYFVMEPNGTVGYYSSTRPDSNGEKDIYKITFHRVSK